jgi:hypothetical protein
MRCFKLNENNFKPRLHYSARLLFTIEGEMKVSYGKQKQKQFMTTKPTLQEFEGILHREDEGKPS